MAEWVYKANTTRANFDDTHDLAVFNHFLCRSAYEGGNDADRLRAVGVVAEVKVGDLIHFYYRRDNGKVSCLGTFRVADGSARPAIFALCEGHGALCKVIESPENQKIVDRLLRGYDRDPRLEAFTGWVIDKLPSAHPTPAFDMARMFPGPHTNMWPYPDPNLPKKAKRR
ncbi:hypothetical protein WME98_31960 [Sorangium sp. So ce296]|uniref:hypothetical protein n=1 Tax=Sorangium sp. So ce296 TaxID=3133296 RepID=UPI003F61540A